MVNETVLSRMVKDFGDQVMTTITHDLYGSGLVYLLVFGGGTAALLSLAFSLHKREAPVKALMFFAAWFACLPVGGRPLAYAVVNGLGTSLAYQLQKSSLKILDGTSGAKTMPPGFVMNALLRGAKSEITDPKIYDDVAFVMDNCVPNVPNKEGGPLTVGDLFGGTWKNAGTPGETHDERFDPQYLKARKFDRGGGTVNCYQVLVDARTRLRSHLESKELTKTPEQNYLGSSSGEVQGGAVTRTSWPEPTTREAQKVRGTAINLATAAAVQKVAMGQMGLLDVNSYFDEKVYRSTDVAVSGHFAAGGDTSFGSGNWLTKMTYDLMSAPTAIARSLNVDGAIKSGLALQEMNEKLLSLPYYVAFTQSVLKILAPVAVLTLLFGTFKIFFSWSFVWTLTLVMPVVMQISRGISNSVLFYSNKIGELGSLLESEPGFMAIGVNFDAASKIIADSSRMMQVILSVELGVWGALLLLVPAGAWFAGNIANRLTATVAGGLAGGVARGAAYRVGGAAMTRSMAVGGAALGATRRAGGRVLRPIGTHAARAVTFVRGEIKAPQTVPGTKIVPPTKPSNLGK
jgi:hypothetical protein